MASRPRYYTYSSEGLLSKLKKDREELIKEHKNETDPERKLDLLKNIDTTSRFISAAQDAVERNQAKIKERAERAAAQPIIDTATLPTQTQPRDLTESAKVAKAILGQAPTVTFTPIAPRIKELFQNQKPATINPLAPEVFESRKEALKEDLRQEFFGPLGRVQNVAASEAAAGRLGRSGVSTQVLQTAALDPFQEGLRDIDRQIAEQSEADRRFVEEFNARSRDEFNARFQQAMTLALQTDSANRLAAQQATAQLQSQYNDIVSKIAMFEQGQISEREMFETMMDFKALELSTKVQQWGAEMAAAYTQLDMSAFDYVKETMESLKNKGTDLETALGIAEAFADQANVNRETIYNVVALVYFGRIPDHATAAGVRALAGTQGSQNQQSNLLATLGINEEQLRRLPANTQSTILGKLGQISSLLGY